MNEHAKPPFPKQQMAARELPMSARACARYGVLVDGKEMKRSSGNVRRTVSDRHLPFQSSRSRQSYRVVGGGADPVDGPLRPTARLSAIGTFARSTRLPDNRRRSHDAADPNKGRGHARRCRLN
jgi:hypothetical protein